LFGTKRITDIDPCQTKVVRFPAGAKHIIKKCNAKVCETINAIFFAKKRLKKNKKVSSKFCQYYKNCIFAKRFYFIN